MCKLCFILKEVETLEDKELLSVAQMKARRITESFENPFRMVGDDVNDPQYCVQSVGGTVFISLLCDFSIYPPVTCMLMRMQSLTPPRKYLR